MIAFPRTPADAAALLSAHPDAVLRAGATDLSDLRHRGLLRGPVVDLRDTAGLRAADVTGGGLRLGAGLSLATIAAHPLVRASWPGLAAAAGGLATPQIRESATLAGSLLQDVRCWYYRDPDAHCLKKGGSRCLAREGDSLQHSCWDLGACIAPHPSTMAMALLALDATVDVVGAPGRTIAALLGDGQDPRRTHTLEPGAVLTAVVLPPPAVGARAAYHRTIQRSRSEWPLVEAYVQVEIEDGRFVRPRVAVGGVANRPVRLTEVEKALTGLAVAADPTPAFATVGARGGIASTAWRARLVVPTLRDTLALALQAAPATALPAPGPPPAPPPTPPPAPARPRGGHR